MRCNPVIKNFTEHLKSLTVRKDATDTEVPKILKTLHIMKWTEAFSNFSRRVIGTRKITLSCVIRDTVAISGDTPPLMPNQTYAAEFGSVEEEMIAHATHTHPLYHNDNAYLYFYSEEATRSTMYTSSIQPYSRLKDGCGAWIAITNHYAGKDKWGAELKKQDDLLHTCKWKVQP